MQRLGDFQTIRLSPVDHPDAGLLQVREELQRVEDGVASAAGAKLGELVMRFALGASTADLLLTPANAQVRTRAKVFVKGLAGPVQRAWKGYPFETLNALEEKDFISQSKRAKSVYLTEAGIRRAEELRSKYLGRE